MLCDLCKKGVRVWAQKKKLLNFFIEIIFIVSTIIFNYHIKRTVDDVNYTWKWTMNIRQIEVKREWMNASKWKICSLLLHFALIFSLLCMFANSLGAFLVLCVLVLNCIYWSQNVSQFRSNKMIRRPNRGLEEKWLKRKRKKTTPRLRIVIFFFWWTALKRKCEIGETGLVASKCILLAIKNERKKYTDIQQSFIQSPINLHQNRIHQQNISFISRASNQQIGRNRNKQKWN